MWDSSQTLSYRSRQLSKLLLEEIKITNALNEFKRNVRPYIVGDNAYRLCRSYIKIKDFLEKEISG